MGARFNLRTIYFDGEQRERSGNTMIREVLIEASQLMAALLKDRLASTLNSRHKVNISLNLDSKGVTRERSSNDL